MGKRIDILIRGAMVYDGTGNEPIAADIAIKGDRIAALFKPGEFGGDAERVIEAEGLSVAPGFIDTHSHSEFTLLADSRAEGKVLQGITTEVNGNCGLSAAPVYGDALRQREKDLEEFCIKERWSTFREYFRILEDKGIAVNFATLAGHGNLRASVIGYDNRAPNEAELRDMVRLLREAIGDGAIGISTGLIYPPGVYAKTEEIIELTGSIRDCIYTSHIRSEGSELIEAVEETIRIGRESGIAIHVSHIKTAGKANWHKIDQAISLIEDAAQEGIRVTCDRYPYTAASTDLDAILPSWAYIGGNEEELNKLNDPRIRAAIRHEVLSQHPSGDYWSSIKIASVNSGPNKWMEGKDLSYISERAGKMPVDLFLDLLIEERLRVSAIFHSMCEENLLRFLSLPCVMVGSDSSARSFDGPTHKGKPHPRGFGSFPRFIGMYVRDKGLMNLSEAIRKTTMLPAMTFGLKDRGQIRNGFFADIVIFDDERIIDRATFDDPFVKPDGVCCVLVNGSLAVWDAAPTGIMAGRVLRHGG